MVDNVDVPPARSRGVRVGLRVLQPVQINFLELRYHTTNVSKDEPVLLLHDGVFVLLPVGT